MNGPQLAHSQVAAQPHLNGRAPALLAIGEEMGETGTMPVVSLRGEIEPTAADVIRAESSSQAALLCRLGNVGPFLSRSLNMRWESYLEQLTTSQQKFSEEAVHQLRVATRRLIA